MVKTSPVVTGGGAAVLEVAGMAAALDEEGTVTIVVLGGNATGVETLTEAVKVDRVVRVTLDTLKLVVTIAEPEDVKVAVTGHMVVVSKMTSVV